MVRMERDRDFLRTRENFFFCVVGYAHPPGRVLAYLKYVPSSAGRWGKRGKFHRILSRYDAAAVADTFKFLRKYPKYLYYSDVYGIVFSAVPGSEIESRYYPEVKVAKLLEEKRVDPLQEKALSLISLLSRESGVPLRRFGVTGSILIDIHNPSFSDVDLTVYGRRYAVRVKEAILSLRGRDVKTFTGRAAEEWVRKKEGVFQLSKKQARKILERKWNIGFYRGTRFSIHPVRIDEEIDEKYGDRVFRKVGMCTIKATISSSKDAIFLPCKYEVEDVTILEGDCPGEIKEVVSYEGLFCDIAGEGERVRVHGKLEKVKGRGEEYYRVVVGSQEANARDYIHLEDAT
nr:hypothetical protein [Candidatus Bathyarchaeota archaeon]